jgi:two-component system, OmpR family, sensor histidine kinase ChvG
MKLFGSAGERRHSVLRWRIILLNTVVFAVLIAGVTWVQTSRVGLVDERMTGVEEEARVVAATLAEYATITDSRAINTQSAAELLRDLLGPTRLRARLYDTDGQLIVDTRYLLARNVVQVSELPPIDRWSRFKQMIGRIYDSVMGVRPYGNLEPYFEAGQDGRVYHEVNAALDGAVTSTKRIDEHNKLVLSTAAPVQRFKAIYGVLFVSTEGGDIDNILRLERAKLIEVFLLATVVMIAASLYLSWNIAEPMRHLAAAADRVRHGRSGRETVPDMSDRGDEIGDLAESMSAMTRALYDRIDAIESFAADVAHELKNPLTSLRSAVDMFSRAKDEESRTRLLSIVRADTKRIDRLITDISDASRLDAELSRETATPVDIARLLETIVEIYKMMELPRGVKVDLKLELPPDAAVMGRDERLGQVIRNLVDNAVSFSPPQGTVAIAARTQPGVVNITVDDQGPGIPPENLETIFKRFYTERPQDHDFGKNSGLGLSIARQIAEGTGGRIWAENRPEGGARFTVQLPLAGLSWQR